MSVQRSNANAASAALAAETCAFERDSLPWAFGRIAEETLRATLTGRAMQRRYAWWLQHEAPLAEGSEPMMQMSRDGNCELWARQRVGEFVLTVESRDFVVVLACVAVAEQATTVEAVCLAHFEGDASKALQWHCASRRSRFLRRGMGYAGRSAGPVTAGQLWPSWPRRFTSNMILILITE